MGTSTHIPIRMCVGCHKKLPQEQLQRFVIRDPQALQDDTIRQSGRGMYICSPECEARFETSKVGKKHQRKDQS